MSAVTASDLERYMLGLLNEERTSRGLTPLVLDKVLNASADAHSLWLLQNNVFSHTGVGGSTPTERMTAEGFDLSGTWRTAENIAAQSERGKEGLFDDVYDLHIALMNSKGHRETILMPELEVVGIGIQTGNFRYDSGTYFSVMVTQNFAMTGGQTTPDIAQDTNSTPDNSNTQQDMASVLVGTANAEYILGTAQDDTITGSGGNDILSGEAGRDTAVYMSDMSNYALTISNGSIVIEDRSGGDGTDTLNSIEVLQFQNTEFKLGQFTGTGALTDTELSTFIELYIAYFNRAPDAIGLNFWGSRFADGRTLEQIAEQFALSAEMQATYPPGTTTQAFVEAVYDNVLGRPADAAGLAFWIDKLDTGVFTRDVFILRTLAGAKSELKPELGEDFVNQQLADRKYLEDKTDIGAYYAVIRGMSDVEDAITAMNLFDGTDTSITDAVAAIDGFYADASDPYNGDFLMPLIGVLDDPFAVG